MGTRWVVGKNDVEEFIKAKRLRSLSGKTIRDEVRYIRLALSLIGFLNLMALGSTWLSSLMMVSVTLQGTSQSA